MQVEGCVDTHHREKYLTAKCSNCPKSRVVCVTVNNEGALDNSSVHKLKLDRIFSDAVRVRSIAGAINSLTDYSDTRHGKFQELIRLPMARST
jgi:hypothetical protein